ncbi:MAG: GAF domain-containing protein [Bacteroidales bacterium]
MSEEKNGNSYIDEVGINKSNNYIDEFADENKFYEAVFNKIVGITEAGAAVFYVGNNDQTEFDLLFSFGINRSKVTKKIAKGEGITGQIAIDGKLFVMRNIAPDVLKIMSGIGNLVPAQIVVIPLALDGQVFAIAEVATLKNITGVMEKELEDLIKEAVRGIMFLKERHV